MRISLPRSALLVAACLILIVPQAFAGVRVVDCDKGDSLQKAIESGAGSAAELEIQLFGTCFESFSFTRDKLVIQGDGNTTIVGEIRMFASDQVVFSDLTITGPGSGLTVFNGRARFLRVHLIGNDGRGITGRQGAAITLRDSTINDNHGGFGIFLEHATAIVNNSEVIGNWGHGIGVHQNSTLSLLNATVHANENNGIDAILNSVVEASESHIWENRGVGIFMRSGSAGEIHDTRVNANAQQGVEVSGNSVLDVYGGEVGWNGDHGAWVAEHSVLRLIDGQVHDNIGHGLVIRTDGGVILEGASAISDNTEFFQVVCHGHEASIEIDPLSFADPLDCPDPDF